MDKIILRTGRLCTTGCNSWHSAISAPLSDSPGSRASSTDSPGKGLDADPSWEAAILRHEKLIANLKKEGVKREDLPELESEEKLKKFSHLAFHGKSKFEKDEALLNDVMKMLLGNATPRKEIDSKIRAVTNIDPDFARDDVQELLKRIHYRCDMEKVYRYQIKDREVMPSVKYMTDEQLQEERRKFEEEIVDRLEMPPVLLERKPCSEILAEDNVLDGYEDSRLSFIDISEGLKERERFIVMRETNGILRKAEWEERDRLIQTYYPFPGRKIVPASLFHEETIKNVFDQKLHENALDQCIAQFDLDSKEYIRTFEAIYRDIDDHKLYDLLRSTRYFGGLVFFLTKTLSLDGIILDMLNKDMLDSAADCVLLLTLLHPDCKTKTTIENLQATDHISILQGYIEGDCTNQKVLSIALERLQSSSDENDSANKTSESAV